MSATSEGTSEAPANPARPWAATITPAVGLTTMSTMAARKSTTATWKKILEPKRCPSFAPSMTKAETPSEYITIAVPTVVGGVLKLAIMPLMETGRAATLKDMSIWPMAMTIMGTHESCTSGAGPVVDAARAVMRILLSCMGPSRFRGRGEEIQSQPVGEERRHELPLHAVAGLVESRGERAQPAFAR